MKKIIQLIVPFSILFILFMLLYKALFSNPTHEMPSALLHQTIPLFSLRDVVNDKRILSDQSFKNQSITVLNIWATWCYACRLEHDVLMTMKNDYHLPIYSIVYKDNKKAITEWLAARGNPYEMVGLDQNGDVAIDFGIYGTPETFLITASGEVIYRHVGALTNKVWQDEMLPIVKRYMR